MCNFSLGMMAGTLFGAGVILALNPMDKRAMRRARCRAEKMVDRMGRAFHDMV